MLEQGIRRLESQIKEVKGIISDGNLSMFNTNDLFTPGFIEDLQGIREEHNANMLKLLQDALDEYKKEFDEL